MSTTNPQPTNRTRRRPFQFTLSGLFGLVVVANLCFACLLYQPSTWDRVRIHVTDEGVMVGREWRSWEELPDVLSAEADRISLWREMTPQEIRVEMTVGAETEYWRFLEAVETCRDAGLWRIELRVDAVTQPYYIATHEEVMQYNDRITMFNRPPAIPPFAVDLLANQQGDLTQIETPLGVAGECELQDARFPRIRQWVARHLGTRSGTKAPRDRVFIELKSDGLLRFKHVAALLRAATKHAPRDGVRVPLIRRIALPDDLVDPRVFQDSLECILTAETKQLLNGPPPPRPWGPNN